MLKMIMIPGQGIGGTLLVWLELEGRLPCPPFPPTPDISSNSHRETDKHTQVHNSLTLLIYNKQHWLKLAHLVNLGINNQEKIFQNMLTGVRPVIRFLDPPPPYKLCTSFFISIFG